MTIDYTDISSVDVDGDINATGIIGSSKQGKVVGTLATMPTASADYEGVTVQFTGATAGGFTHNAFYRCEASGGGYVWTKVTTGDDTAGSLTHPIYMNAGVPTPTTYELNAAGARGVDTAVTDGSANLPTSDAVHDYVKDSTIAIKSAGGATVGDFSLNQASNEDIVLPASAMQFNDRSVTFTLQGTPEFADYPYRAQFAVTGITADDYAEVAYSAEQVASGYYAPFCKTVSGYVYLYANANVGTVNVPTISVGNYESNPDHSDPAWDAKLSKIESAGLRAYTHNGAEQGDIAVTSASTANTIMQRDASGSTQVADTPTNTHSAVNQAYVESTVDGINNLVHKSGNESISGNKNFSGEINIDFLSRHRIFCEHSKWTKIISNNVGNSAWRDLQINFMGIGTSDYDGMAKIHIPGNVTNIRIGKNYGGSTFTLSMIKCGYKLASGSTTGGVVEIWVSPSTRHRIASIMEIGTQTGGFGISWDFTTTTQDTEPDWANDYDGVIVGVDP